MQAEEGRWAAVCAQHIITGALGASDAVREYILSVHVYEQCRRGIPFHDAVMRIVNWCFAPGCAAVQLYCDRTGFTPAGDANILYVATSTLRACGAKELAGDVEALHETCQRAFRRAVPIGGMDHRRLTDFVHDAMLTVPTDCVVRSLHALLVRLWFEARVYTAGQVHALVELERKCRACVLAKLPSSFALEMDKWIALARDDIRERPKNERLAKLLTRLLLSSVSIATYNSTAVMMCLAYPHDALPQLEMPADVIDPATPAPLRRAYQLLWYLTTATQETRDVSALPPQAATLVYAAPTVFGRIRIPRSVYQSGTIDLFPFILPHRIAMPPAPTTDHVDAPPAVLSVAAAALTFLLATYIHRATDDGYKQTLGTWWILLRSRLAEPRTLVRHAVAEQCPAASRAVAELSNDVRRVVTHCEPRRTSAVLNAHAIATQIALAYTGSGCNSTPTPLLVRFVVTVKQHAARIANNAGIALNDAESAWLVDGTRVTAARNALHFVSGKLDTRVQELFAPVYIPGEDLAPLVVTRSQHEMSWVAYMLQNRADDSWAPADRLYIDRRVDALQYDAETHTGLMWKACMCSALYHAPADPARYYSVSWLAGAAACDDDPRMLRIVAGAMLATLMGEDTAPWLHSSVSLQLQHYRALPLLLHNLYGDRLGDHLWGSDSLAANDLVRSIVLFLVQAGPWLQRDEIQYGPDALREVIRMIDAEAPAVRGADDMVALREALVELCGSAAETGGKQRRRSTLAPLARLASWCPIPIASETNLAYLYWFLARPETPPAIGRALFAVFKHMRVVKILGMKTARIQPRSVELPPVEKAATSPLVRTQLDAALLVPAIREVVVRVMTELFLLFERRGGPRPAGLDGYLDRVVACVDTGCVLPLCRAHGTSPQQPSLIAIPIGDPTNAEEVFVYPCQVLMAMSSTFVHGRQPPESPFVTYCPWLLDVLEDAKESANEHTFISSEMGSETATASYNRLTQMIEEMSRKRAYPATHTGKRICAPSYPTEGAPHSTEAASSSVAGDTTMAELFGS